MLASWYNNGIAQFVYVVVWAFVMVRLTPYWLRFLDRIEGEEVDTPSQLPTLSDHQIRKAIQDTGRMLREAGALQGETFLTDDGEEQQQQKGKAMRKFRVHVRPFTGSVTVFDYDTDVSASQREWEALSSSSLLDGNEDEWNVAVMRYANRLHGFQIISVHELSWPLWLSQVLSNADIAVVREAINCAFAEWGNAVDDGLSEVERITYKYTTDVMLGVE